ncbi:MULTISPECIES: FG-GAP repeat domain-containing protein [unclassified Streptomyces]|uniref:FG-GAP repeat domain-containing protein n=1 Tax=unclassified Streptomyces TaxID=2593676 RepID=UPI00370162E1
MRRIVALGGAVVMLAAGAVGGASAASAATQELIDFTVQNRVLQPGVGWAELGPTSFSYGGDEDGSDSFDGTLVYALSKAPLTDAAWTKGGLPTGLSLDEEGSTCSPGSATGIYLCPITDENGWTALDVAAAASTAHGTTLHYGVVYVPRGADAATMAKAVKEAQTAGSLAETGWRAARTVTVKSLAHVSQNTVKFSTPQLPAGGTATHTVTVHAVDKGKLEIGFEPGTGMRDWEMGEVPVYVTGTGTSSSAAQCDHYTDSVSEGAGLSCDVDPGGAGPVDVTVSYTMKAASTTAAWRINTYATYDVYDWGLGNPEASSEFAVQSSRPVPARFAMVSRDKSGALRWHYGTGKAASPFRDYAESVGSGWQIYNTVTKLAPLTVQAGGGGLVARDASGVLWHYRTTGRWYEPFAARTKVGGGWQIYDSITGVGDVSGDGKADLIARDKTGVLWLYQGNGTGGFAVRVKVGGGWQTYNQITGSGDLDGDRKADLIARDKTGVLWAYKGTGKASGPLGARVKVGGGWQAYPMVTAPGDLNDDGRADLVARDGAGKVYLYRGTGKLAVPYSARSAIGVADLPSSVNLLF